MKQRLLKGEKISRDEEAIYLKEVFGLSEYEIQLIFAIVANKDPNIFPD